MKYLLHIDTATDTATVAIGADGVLVAERTADTARNHATMLNTMIQEALTDAGITLHQLSGIAVCAGPGSYTGLRIGMATAKGLCYALDIPLLADSRLAMLADSARADNTGYAHYAALITARENEYFMALYDKEFLCIMEPQHVLAGRAKEILENAENVYIKTDVAEPELYNPEVNKHTADNNIKTDVKSWIRYTFAKYKCNDIVNLASAEPFYLKQVYTHK